MNNNNKYGAFVKIYTVSFNFHKVILALQINLVTFKNLCDSRGLKTSSRPLENHFDKYYELEYNLQKAGKDSELKQIRNITDLADICYVWQKEQNGLGDAIKCGKKHVGD